MITWTEGDLFESGLPAVAHGVNCKGVMGAGIAVQFRKRYPRMYESYRRRCLNGRMLPGDIIAWQHPDGIVFNLATQDKPGPDARPWMITAAVGRMIQEAHYIYKIPRIAMPMIGCGIGGLTPAELRDSLAPYTSAPVDLVILWYQPATAARA